MIYKKLKNSLLLLGLLTFTLPNLIASNELPNKIYLTDPRCQICIEDNLDKKYYALECGHCFHKECIERWGLQKHKCPTCNNDTKLLFELSDHKSFFQSVQQGERPEDLSLHFKKIKLSPIENNDEQHAANHNTRSLAMLSVNYMQSSFFLSVLLSYMNHFSVKSNNAAISWPTNIVTAYLFYNIYSYTKLYTQESIS